MFFKLLGFVLIVIVSKHFFNLLRQTVKRHALVGAITFFLFKTLSATQVQNMTGFIIAVTMFVGFIFCTQVAVRNNFVSNPLPHPLVKHKILPLKLVY